MKPLKPFDLSSFAHDDETKSISDALISLEIARYQLYRMLAMKQAEFDYNFNRNQQLPPAHAEMIDYQGDTFLCLTFQGMIPHYSQNRKHTENYNLYYINATDEALQQSNLNPNYKKAFVLIVHFFPDTKTRDFDNRQRKFIFDALRLNRITGDDTWQNISTMENGLLDPKKVRVEVYVGDQNSTIKMINFVTEKYVSSMSSETCQYSVFTMSDFE